MRRTFSSNITPLLICKFDVRTRPWKQSQLILFETSPRLPLYEPLTISLNI